MTRGVLLLAGRTASGKTSLAVRLAQRFDAEIVGADSRQIYRGMPIGTAAPRADELAAVPHHLIGFLDPLERYSAARFVDDAMTAIDAIHARGRRALVVGGTGFYLRALAGDVALSAVRDEGVRERLAHEARVHPPEALLEWLAALAPERAAALGVGDPYRVTRALEIALAERLATGAPAERAETDASSAAESGGSLRARGIAFRKLMLEVDDAVLAQRIESRVDAMLAEGLLDEAERIGATAVAANAVGYREAFAHLAGWSTPSELRRLLARATWRYAKRQGTWFRSEPGLERIPEDDAFERISAIAQELPGWS